MGPTDCLCSDEELANIKAKEQELDTEQLRENVSVGMCESADALIVQMSSYVSSSFSSQMCLNATLKSSANNFHVTIHCATSCQSTFLLEQYLFTNMHLCLCGNFELWRSLHAVSHGVSFLRQIAKTKCAREFGIVKSQMKLTLLAICNASFFVSC